MTNNDNRRVQKVIGTFEMWDGRRAREVVATYDGGPPRREIEVGIDECYVPRYQEIDSDDSATRDSDTSAESE